MAPAPILNKKQNYRLWQSGAFGNKLRAWSVEEYRDCNYMGNVAIRMRSGAGGGLCFYDIPRENALAALPFLVCGDLLLDDFMINEMSPKAEILQGEYLNDIRVVDGETSWGWFLYSRAPLRMRDALSAAPETARSLRADLLIREAMTPSSYDDWQILLERYPGHVFEVSIYDRCLGDIPNRNALVWEIRRY